MELGFPAFWALFLPTVNHFFPEIADPSHSPRDTPQEDVASEYDFIIVGAGSAGCVLANRLTENKDWNVLLIEAGEDEDAISKTPFFAFHLHKTSRDWNYTTVKQKRACSSEGGLCHYPRGRGMGGSSSINAMIYIRGGKANYEKWEKLGNPGWGYEDVLPYFIKAENYKGPSSTTSQNLGNSGPLNIQYPKYRSSLWEDYIRAAEMVGFNHDSYNGEDQRNVVDHVVQTVHDSFRHSTSAAYLSPIANRINLNVIKKSIVNKIIFEGKTAKGVKYIRDNKFFEVYARKEVILSAGAIDTPKLLMLSGIGPQDELKPLGIDVLEDLPVGKGLKDHTLVSVVFEVDNVQTMNPNLWQTEQSIMTFAKERLGPLTTFPTEVTVFFNPLNNSNHPTVQIIFITGMGEMLGAGNKSVVWCALGLIDPQSVGSVKLKSSNFRDPPVIDPNYFDEDIDIINAGKGLEKLFQFMTTEAMMKYNPKMCSDCHPACIGKTEGELIRCLISENSGPYYHPVRTAKMGPGVDSVVNSLLEVKGVRNLRVVDASVMPEIPTCNTNAPTIMIAEKASDIIKTKYEETTSPVLLIAITIVVVALIQHYR